MNEAFKEVLKKLEEELQRTKSLRHNSTAPSNHTLCSIEETYENCKDIVQEVMKKYENEIDFKSYNKAVSDFVALINTCSGWIPNCIESNISVTVFTLHQIAEQLTIVTKPNKIKVASAEIVVHGTPNKPYYEIKYYDLSDNEYHTGYSSCDLNSVFGWLNDQFEIVKESEGNENE